MPQNVATVKILQAYKEQTEPMLFFTSLFRSGPRNFHNTKDVELHIKRAAQRIAIPLQSMASSARFSKNREWVKKTFTPAVFKEGSSIDAYELMGQEFNETAYADPNFRVRAARAIVGEIVEKQEAIRRSIEVMCSQVLQTGTLLMNDDEDNQVYELNFQPRPELFPTAAIAWDDAAADIQGDLVQLCNAIRDKGKGDPDHTYWGQTAFDNAMKNDAFKAIFESRRADQGRISMMTPEGNGAMYRGVVNLGAYKLDIYTYNGTYDDPVTGETKLLLDEHNVVARVSSGRLDLSFGSIPTLAPPDARVLTFMPRVIRNASGRIGLSTNAWFSPSGEALKMTVGTRPLPIPVAIDTFGCLKTKAA